MAYLTSAIVEDEIGADKADALTGGSSDTMARLIAVASARVRAALVIGGYTAAVPETVYASDASDCPEEITDLAMRMWLRVAYARRDLSIPEDQVELADQILADVREGRIEIKGVSRATSRAPGGITVSDTSTTSTSGRPQVFSRSRMAGF